MRVRALWFKWQPSTKERSKSKRGDFVESIYLFVGLLINRIMRRVHKGVKLAGKFIKAIIFSQGIPIQK